MTVEYKKAEDSDCSFEDFAEIPMAELEDDKRDTVFAKAWKFLGNILEKEA